MSVQANEVPERLPKMVFSTTHTILNASGVSVEIPYDCYLQSISIAYSAAQTSTSIISIDSGEGANYDYRLNTATLTAATSELITFTDNELFLSNKNSKGNYTTGSDAILFTAVGADSGSAYIIINLGRIKQ